jgi:hypothetical protein
VDSHLALVLPQYMTLASSASFETIRKNPITASYSDTYFKLARLHGLIHARAWLLGSLIRDLHSTATT